MSLSELTRRIWARDPDSHPASLELHGVRRGNERGGRRGWSRLPVVVRVETLSCWWSVATLIGHGGSFAAAHSCRWSHQPLHRSPRASAKAAASKQPNATREQLTGGHTSFTTTESHSVEQEESLLPSAMRADGVMRFCLNLGREAKVGSWGLGSQPGRSMACIPNLCDHPGIPFVHLACR